MPEAEIARRGGATKWRTVKLPDGRTARIAVVRHAGPRGGHTVIGKIRKAKS
jgi:hypothetical protein